MGQAESADDVVPPVTPPEVEATRRRQDYLLRLGIQKDKKAPYAMGHRPPVYSDEAPARLQRSPSLDAGEADRPDSTASASAAASASGAATPDRPAAEDAEGAAGAAEDPERPPSSDDGPRDSAGGAEVSSTREASAPEEATSAAAASSGARPAAADDASAAPAKTAAAGPQKGFEMSFAEHTSQDDFRVNFLRKLSYSKVWVPSAQRPPKHQTVIIFDWDDTLLCTTFLNLRQDQTLTPVVERHLRQIESGARRLLELGMRLGHTFIITNAMNGWVEYSAAKWVPELLPVLQKVRVISARTKYEPQYPGEVSKWKIQAFLEVQRQLDSQIITNLISVGDSNFEMDAVHVMGKEFAQAFIKTIKFRENPSPEELLKQLELVAQKFERIVENARNLKIGLERKWVGGQQQG